MAPEEAGRLPEGRPLPECPGVEPPHGPRAEDGAFDPMNQKNLRTGCVEGRGQFLRGRDAALPTKVPGVHQGPHRRLESPVGTPGPCPGLHQEVGQRGGNGHGRRWFRSVHPGHLGRGVPGTQESVHALDFPDRTLGRFGTLGRVRCLDLDFQTGAHDPDLAVGPGIRPWGDPGGQGDGQGEVQCADQRDPSPPPSQT